jgi:hypothetical protein
LNFSPTAKAGCSEFDNTKVCHALNLKFTQKPGDICQKTEIKAKQTHCRRHDEEKAVY